MRRSFGRIVFLLGCALGVAAPGARGQNLPTFVTIAHLPAPITGAACSSNGALVTIDGGNEVMLYRNLSTNTRAPDTVVKVGSKIAAIVPKTVGNSKGFLVLSTGDHTLYVLDSNSLQTVESIPLTSDGYSVAAPSVSENPYAYVCHVPNAKNASGAVRHDTPEPFERINLITGKSEGFLTGVEPNLNTFAVSADGAYLYATSHGATNSGVRVYRISINGKDLAADLVASDRMEAPDFIPDYTGAYVACGTKLLTSDWKTVPGAPAMAIQAFLPDRPMGVYIASNNMQFFSEISLQHAGSIPLPNPNGRGANQPRGRAVRGPVQPAAPEPTGPVMLVPNRYEVYAIQGTTVAVFPYQSATPPDPQVFVRAADSLDLSVGVPTSVSLAPETAGTVFSLASTPKGMNVSGNTLLWTPGPDDVGHPMVTLKVSRGNLEHTQELMLTVRRPSVAVPFTPTGMVLTPSGKSAVVYTSIGSVAPGMPRPHGAIEPRVALVDLGRQTVVAERTLKKDFRLVTADDGAIYLAASDGDSLTVLSAHDLADTKQIALKSRVQQILSTGTKFFADNTVYNLPGLDLADSKSPVSPSSATAPANQVARPALKAGGVAIGGVLFDAGLSRPRLVYAVPNDVPAFNGRDVSATQPLQDALSLWGVGNSAGYRSTTGPNDQSTPPQMLADIPASIELRSTQLKMPRDANRTDTMYMSAYQQELVLTDLVAKKPAATMALSQIYEPTGVARTNGLLLQSAGGRIAALSGGRLYTVSTSDFAAAASGLSTPVYIDPDQSAIEIPAGKTAQLTYAAHGGKGTLNYTLATPFEGLAIDSKSGTVTVDTTKLAARAADMVASRVRSMAGGSKAFDALLASAKDGYRTALRTEPAGFPFALSISISAHDAEQSATLSHYVFVSFNADELRAVVEKAGGSSGGPH